MLPSSTLASAEARRSATATNNRFAAVIQCPCDQPDAMPNRRCITMISAPSYVTDKLLQVDGVLVWVNPIEGGRDRSMLDCHAA